MLQQLKRVFSNWYVFSIISKVTLVLIGLLYSALSSRYLGPSLKGETAYISSVVTTVGIFTSFGLHQDYPYYRKTVGKDKIVSSYMSNIVLLHLVYAIIAFLACIFTSTNENFVIAIFIPVASYYRIVSYVATIEKPNQIQLINVIIELIEIIIILILMFTVPSNYLIAVLFLVSKEIIQGILFTFRIGATIRFRNIDLNLLYEMMKYGFFPM